MPSFAVPQLVVVWPWPEGLSIFHVCVCSEEAEMRPVGLAVKETERQPFYECKEAVWQAEEAKRMHSTAVRETVHEDSKSGSVVEGR